MKKIKNRNYHKKRFLENKNVPKFVYKTWLLQLKECYCV